MAIEAYVLDWLNLVLRWAHIITGIAWIGSSFYFMWLDARLNVPPRDPEGPDVAGDLWAVHGGGFYHAQKYKIAPAELPEPLHWFKWEAYATWLTGFLLLTVVYYANADALLVNPDVADIDAASAIALSVLLLPAGWFLYDALCRLVPGGGCFALLGATLVLGLCYGIGQLYGGRGAFMQVGVMLGTIMAANVWRVIIPSQKTLVAAKLAGAAPDAALGARAKQRSVHNNYLTLPVVFAMISPHFAFTYAHPHGWLVLFLLFAGGALVRHFFNLRNHGRHAVALPVAAVVLGVGLAIALAPRGREGAPVAGQGASFAEVNRILHMRCVTCHSAAPDHPTAPVAAAGVMFDTSREIKAWAPRIFERAVATRTMPLANLTAMTDDEREVIARWYAGGAPAD
ncbi:MAG TPA: urate hydroxylase PuuD [Steroidobacteraceae bacterium]